MPTKSTSDDTHSNRKPQLDVVLIQLSSQRPSDVWRGMEQIRQLLKGNPEDREVYGLLLDAVQKNHDLRGQVRNLLIEMTQNDSKVAEQALLQLPSGIPDLLADADDAYYAGEYEKSIQLYRQILRLEPQNTQAKEHMAKAILKRDTGESPTDIPRAAQQYYRRARSYMAAREAVTALNLLSAAIEAAQAKGMKYPEAEAALNDVNNLVLADEYLNKAKDAQRKRKRKNAIELYEKALRLDPTNTDIRKKIRAQRVMLNIWWGILIPFLAVVLFGYRYFSTLPTITPTLSSSVTATSMVASTTPAIQTTVTRTSVTNTDMPSPTSTITLTPHPTFTETLSPTVTESVLGIGYINKAVASIWEEPNSGFLGQLNLKQPLTLLEEIKVSGDTWYRCRWEINDESYEGWILEDNINFGPPPP